MEPLAVPPTPPMLGKPNPHIFPSHGQPLCVPPEWEWWEWGFSDSRQPHRKLTWLCRMRRQLPNQFWEKRTKVTASHLLISSCITKLSYTKQYGTDMKPMERNQMPRNEPMCGQVTFGKKRQEYSMGMFIVFSINGAGKTECLHAEEWNCILILCHS